MSRDTKKCIKDFVHHVEQLEAEEDVEGNGFNREYRLIHEVQVKNRRDNVFQMTAGKADNNLKKNRYKDILPYDEHRVKLSLKEGEENSDYINASLLMGVKGTQGYLASQGPLAATVDDFWRMVWEYNVEIIFMACRIVELGKIKCKQYWHDVDKSDTFGDVTVFTEAEEEISFDFIRRKFRLQRDGEERQVTQFHYLGWPDHGIPDDPSHIRDLISIVRQNRENDQAPLLVHCSAGCGRTGAIVAIDFVWTLLEQGRFDETFSLYELICNLREQRMSMVQTADQYALVNKVLKTLCEEWLEKMASHTYVNVELKQDAGDTDGHQKRVILSPNYPEINTKLANARPQEQAADLNFSPEDTELPSYIAPKPPSESESGSSTYNNVILLPNQSPVFRRVKLDDDSNDNSFADTKDEKETTIHTTVIQLGTGPATTAPSQPTSSSGGSRQVVNFVRGSSTSSSKSSISSSSSAVTGATPPTSPIAAATPGWKESDTVVYAAVNKPGCKSASGATPPRLPVATATPGCQASDAAVYATVNKPSCKSASGATPPRLPVATATPGRQVSNAAVYATVNKPGHSRPASSSSNNDGTPARKPSVNAGSKASQPPGGARLQIVTDSDGYSEVQVQDGRAGASAVNSSLNSPYSLTQSPARHLSIDNDPYSLSTEVLNGPATNVSLSRPAGDSIGAMKNSNGCENAGFGDRLPRVQGPQPFPQSWTKEQ